MISSFQRNLIQVELRKRLDSWYNGSSKSQAYGNLAVNESIDKFATERDQDGYYYISDDLIAYCNLRNGLVFRIRKNFFDKDWTSYSELAAKGIELGTFRVDTPLFRASVETSQGTWEYAELQSPGNDYGQNFNDDVFHWPELTDGVTPNASINDTLRQQVRDYFKTFIDQSYVITHAAREIADKNGCGMPLDLCSIFNRYKDDAGYFWSDFDQAPWIHSKDVVVKSSIETLMSATLHASVCGVLTTEQVNEIYLYARDKWATI